MIKVDAVYCRYCQNDLRVPRLPPTLKPEPVPKKRGCGNCFAIFIAGLILLLLFTNPTQEVHESFISNHIAWETAQAGQEFFGEPGLILGWIFGKGIGNIATSLGVWQFDYHNFFLFSIMTSKGQLVSVGFLHYVIVVSDSSTWYESPAWIPPTLTP